MNDYKVGDIVQTPDGGIAEVVYLPPDGKVAVESPWTANWIRYWPNELERLNQS
jgi:hypothetical protein